ncbi:hypothetical protein L873DRAFT_1773048 [Choiromyces venosus 120613-1]|uniref:Aminoglycoside phosphotransferase domain-containing protein n=1 Tax=Choiromyces venosus 120613-1 TaxID=1336337 RepID=A0A3N4JI24_9PEZI|nr:hypothetical protein L873DRAFT_1773048 [Choiromyces venosus 120613-1]
MLNTPQQPRVRWKPGIFSPIPTWTENPQISVIESLCRRHLYPDTPLPVSLTITFLAEGAFNKLYTVSASTDSSDSPELKVYVFRVSLPVEPFYKTTSEVATLAYIRRYTTIPVPEVIAHSATVENELGFEWILMEKVHGVSLSEVWPHMAISAKEEITEQVASCVLQMRALCRFDAIGSLYCQGALEEKEGVDVLDAKHDAYVIGPLVTSFFFVGGRRLRVRRNRGPYLNDHDYVLALTEVELEDMKLLKESTEDAADYDKYMAEDVPDIVHATHQLQDLLPSIFCRPSTPLGALPSTPSGASPDPPKGQFVLCHHDLSLSNVIVDPATYKITGIVDWECVGIIPTWGDTYPQFLVGPEADEEPEPLADGETDELLLETWDDWEKMRLRKVFDGVVGQCGDSGMQELKREFREQLDMLGFSVRFVERWLKAHLDDGRLLVPN